MFDSLSFLFSGIVFGLAAGLVPGPLLTLVISETIRHNRKEGILVATAPAVTDIPIILLSVLILSELSDFKLILGIISFTGALFIAYMAYESITIKGFHPDLQNVKAESLKKGILTNALSPHPYLFWITVGAPTVVKGLSVSLLSVVFFLSGFYLFLIGSKVVIALIVDRSKSFLKGNTYVFTIRTLGFVLLFFAVLYLKDALKLFGVFQSLFP